MKKILILLTLVLSVHSVFGLTTQVEDEQRLAAEKFMQRYVNKQSYKTADDDGKIAKLTRIRKLITRITERKKDLSYKKQLLLTEISNVACEKSDALGGPECAHIFVQIRLEDTSSVQKSLKQHRQENISEVNTARQRNNISPLLEQNSQLDNIAQKYANHLCNNKFLSHTGKDGSTLESRTKGNYNYQYIGENIASGPQNADVVVNNFLRSPGHRKNLLNTVYSEIGVGHCDGYWVHLYGHPFTNN